MTGEEREALLVAFNSILASLRQVEMRVKSAEVILEGFPDLHSKYVESLDHEKAKTENALSTAHEYLRKTLGKNME